MSRGQTLKTELKGYRTTETECPFFFFFPERYYDTRRKFRGTGNLLQIYVCRL